MIPPTSCYNFSWGCFFPCCCARSSPSLSGDVLKGVKSTSTYFHVSKQSFWSFTGVSSIRTLKDLLCHLIALFPLVIWHYTWSQPIWYFGCPLANTALQVTLWTWHFGTRIPVSKLSCGLCTQVSSPPCTVCSAADVTWLPWPSQWLFSFLLSCC